MYFVLGRFLLFCAAVYSLGARANGYEYYEGLGDYRLVTASEKKETGGCIALDGKSIYATDGTASTSKFHANNTISVFLKNAQFSYIAENYPLTFIPKGKGQVAIVVNVTQAPDQLAAPGSAGIPGRVVFYSPDLHQGQSINQSFGSVYGPKPYSNGVLNLDMTVLELDHDDSDQMMPELLKTVASLGISKLAVASPLVQEVLNSIGAVVVAGSKAKDDIMAKYRLTLLQDYPASKEVDIPLLREGDLIVVRKTDRAKAVEWGKYRYCPATGQLQNLDGSWPELGYVVFSIVKDVQGDDQSLHLLPVTTLLEEVQKSNDPAMISSVQESLAKIEVVAMEGKTFAGAKDDLDSLQDSKTQYREIPAGRLAGLVQLSLLRATDAAKFDALKADKACSAQGEFFSRVVNATYLEVLAGKIKALPLSIPIDDQALNADSILGDVSTLDCATLPGKRTGLAKLLAGSLKPADPVASK